MPIPLTLYRNDVLWSVESAADGEPFYQVADGECDLVLEWTVSNEGDGDRAYTVTYLPNDIGGNVVIASGTLASGAVAYLPNFLLRPLDQVKVDGDGGTIGTYASGWRLTPRPLPV